MDKWLIREPKAGSSNEALKAVELNSFINKENIEPEPVNNSSSTLGEGTEHDEVAHHEEMISDIEASDIEFSDTEIQNASVDSKLKRPNTRKRKKYEQKFKQEWKSKVGNWCEEESGRIYCKVCKKSYKGGITHLERHKLTDFHKNNEKKTNLPKITNIYSDAKKLELRTREAKARAAEFKCVMFLHEHNLPFLLMDHFPKFLLSVCSDIQTLKDMNIARRKATLITTDCFQPEAIEIITKRAIESVGYSLIIDETTDVSTNKSLAVVMRFFEENDYDHFFGLIKVNSCTAESLYNAVIELLNKHKVPVEKMLGFAADNASVMMGNIKGVQAHFKRHNPNLFVMGCVCHSFHLCSSAAATKLPPEIEDFARGIYNFFSNSSQRQIFLEECQIFLNEKPHKILKPSQTRWLSLEVSFIFELKKLFICLFVYLFICFVFCRV
ncbi:uncharacterized protein [Temnothorax nylanderi]|uniref:uncharacterized protein isoform X1 n=1 Tax=Temnothorax nylanderi TaxID=102681 RepID=UPI003A887790